jgi:hypothetical protein
MIKFRINTFIKNTLRNLGINIRKSTKTYLLEGFLKRCHPVTTDKELIRVGENTDGGYLIPDDLNGIKACFSPGVAETASFELEMTSRGIKCYLADYSVDGSPIENNLIQFEKKFLGVENNEVYMTLDDWVDTNINNDNNDLILQMDIEGAEYDVILNAFDVTLKKFRILIVEFHDLQTLSEPFGYKIIDTCFRKLLKDFVIVHIHPNNVFRPVELDGLLIPPVMEFTFLRKDRVKEKAYTKTFPHKLDYTCIPEKKDFKLPECWYSQQS